MFISRYGIYFFEVPGPGARGNPHLKFFDFATKRTRELLTLEKPVRFFNTATLSPEGRYLIYTQIDEEASDLMLVENFR